jgi:hypothetical protein
LIVIADNDDQKNPTCRRVRVPLIAALEVASASTGEAFAATQ